MTMAYYWNQLVTTGDSPEDGFCGDCGQCHGCKISATVLPNRDGADAASLAINWGSPNFHGHKNQLKNIGGDHFCHRSQMITHQFPSKDVLLSCPSHAVGFWVSSSWKMIRMRNKATSISSMIHGVSVQN
jgi:hypothetical protein